MVVYLHLLTTLGETALEKKEQNHTSLLSSLPLFIMTR